MKDVFEHPPLVVYQVIIINDFDLTEIGEEEILDIVFAGHPLYASFSMAEQVVLEDAKRWWKDNCEEPLTEMEINWKTSTATGGDGRTVARLRGVEDHVWFAVIIPSRIHDDD